MNARAPGLTEPGDDVFRLLIESVEEYAIFTLDASGRVATWNAGAERLKGWTEEEIIGRPYSVFFPPEDAAAGRPERLLREAAAHGTAEDQAWRVRKDGTRFWADAVLTAARGVDGTLIGFAKVTRDITGRKLNEERALALAVEHARRQVAERAQADAEHRIRQEAALRDVAHTLTAAEGIRPTLEAITRLGLAIGEADGAYLERVDAAAQMVEVVSAAGWGHPPIGALVPYPGSLTQQVLDSGEPEIVDDLPAVESRPMSRLLREVCGQCAGLAAPLHSDHRVLGALVFVRRTGRPGFTREEAQRLAVLADMGALALRRLILTEEAQRHALEERALRHAAAAVSAALTVEEMLPQIAESALEAMGADGALVERLEPTGELRVVASAGRARLSEGVTVPYATSYARDAVELGEPIVIPRVAAAERAPRHWFEQFPDASALVLGLLDAGDVIGALLLLRTPPRNAFREGDVERARAFADLTALAFRKVRLLEESERRRRQVERMMEDRDRLIRGFSHDLRNPLGSAIGFLGLLEDGLTEPARALPRIRAALEASLRLIDDLVDLARADAGHLEVSNVPVDVREVVADVAAQFGAAAEARALTLTVDVPAALPPIETDPVRVRQIVSNLVSNAIKYTPRSGTIDVRLNPRATRREGGSEHGPWLAIHVIDTGPGIAPADQERVFQEFTRLAPDAAEGVGLGLSISRRLARLLAGELTVESEPGRGSTFTLWLPHRPPPRPAEPDRHGLEP